MQESRHILDLKKKQIESNLAALFQDVKTAIVRAMNCLLSRNPASCQDLIREDVRLNDRRRLVEQDCLLAIASQQPVAHDLRDIVADMRIAAELERMGDYASDIAASVLQLNGDSLEALGLDKVGEMAHVCQVMLDDVVRAHEGGDAELARRVAALDDELDHRLSELVNHVLEAMRGDPSLVGNGSRMLWIAHNLERCGDRTTNIAEQVVFRTEGEVVDLN